jgi:hypothetical protein
LPADENDPIAKHPIAQDEKTTPKPESADAAADAIEPSPPGLRQGGWFTAPKFGPAAERSWSPGPNALERMVGNVSSARGYYMKLVGRSAVECRSIMPNFARLLAVSLRSRLFRTRRADARPRTTRHGASARVLGSLLAAVLLLATSEVASSRLDGSRSEWTDAPAIQALPVVHSRALQHGDLDSRSARRTSSHTDTPLPADANRSFAFAATTVARAVVPARPVAGVVSRGYDATAPPVS